MIIAVDFDGTLVSNNWPEIGMPNERLFKQLIQCQKSGDSIILWTNRNQDSLDEAVEFCKKQGLTFNAVNDDIEKTIDIWKNNRSKKITADIYIDDRAVSPGYFVKSCNIYEDFYKKDTL